ncbi:MAG TPA: A/G-specific adenine glycosylase [Candidatus Paceibacterota bacterium]|nr:A/G-specific adenine glycosylase [Candidatus Paceibacterota bacterium]
MTHPQFRKTIWAHYRKNGRHDLAWRKTRDPYRILVSEIMLQQTQVARVAGFYPEFIKVFPNFRALARAGTADVLRAWQGMGYNRRALALQNLSRIVLETFNGKLPKSREELESLPGIGKATAGSLRAFAWNEYEVFIETNIRRVFIHFFFHEEKTVTDEAIVRYITGTLPQKNFREWYWALMDYGAMLGAQVQKAKVSINPNRKSAHYRKQAVFKGSDRELRGKILRLLLKKKKVSLPLMAKAMKEPALRVRRVANVLVREGFAGHLGANALTII